jgi:hypothetical protein
MKIEKISLTNTSSWSACIRLTQLFVLFTLVVFIGGVTSGLGEDVSAGFLFDQFKLTLEDGLRTEAAGPFYYSQTTNSGKVLAFPPFFSRETNPTVETQEDDFLYPIFTRQHYGAERRWQFFELIESSSGLAPDDTAPRRFTIFPFYFQQRAVDTNLNYTAVMPFYGRLQHRLFRDEIYFVMFPAFIETRKRDLVTDNYLFPFVDVHHGDGLEGWQVWPFVGREHKDLTTQTNGFGDVTVIPGHDQWFYVWPFFMARNNGLGTTNTSTVRAAIPFYSATRSEFYDSTSVFWPFFTSIDNRERQYHEWQGPWPFVIFARGEGKHTSRVWPVFSESHNDTKENDSYAWPIYTYARTHTDSLDQQRSRVLFYAYSRLSSKNKETGKERVRLDMWPFFVWHREGNGDERLQVLAPLEPAVPDNPGIERNWSPLWSFWRSEFRPRTGTRNESLLWNLYHRQTTPNSSKMSFFFGLYQSSQQPGDESVRWFYFPPSHTHRP